MSLGNLFFKAMGMIITRFIVLSLLLTPFWGQTSLYAQQLTIEKIYFYNVRGLAVKEFLLNSLNLDKEKGETITLGMDPERDRLKDGSGDGGGGNPFISMGGSSSERELYQ